MAALFFEMQANKFDAEALLRNFGMEKMKINRDKIHRDKIHFFPKGLAQIRCKQPKGHKRSSVKWHGPYLTTCLAQPILVSSVIRE